MFVRGHTVLFLRFRNLVSKERHKRLLRLTAFLWGLEEHGIPSHKRYFIMNRHLLAYVACGGVN